MSNEIMRYKNKFNTLQLGGLTNSQNSIFLAIVSRLQHTETYKYDHNGNRVVDTKPVKLTFAKIKRLSMNHYGRHIARFNRDLVNARKQIMHLSAYAGNKHEFLQVNLFSWFYVNKEKKYCEIKLNPDYYDWLNDLTKNFTRYPVREVNSIQSSYAQLMFMYLKTFRRTGWTKMSMQKLRIKLSVPKSYSGNQVQNRIIKPCWVYLSRFFKNLRFQKLKKHGNRITGYYITFKPEPAKKDDFMRSKSGEHQMFIDNVKLNEYLPRKLKAKALDKLRPKKHQHEPIAVFNRTLKTTPLKVLKEFYKKRNTPLFHFSEYQVRKLRKKIKAMEHQE